MTFMIYSNIAIAASLIIFAVNTITGNVSQVDRLWSIIPTFYTLLFCIHAFVVDGTIPARLVMMAVIQVAWSIRLTRNYWLRGGYKKGTEDYRWAVVRTWFPHPAMWIVFNFFFISIFQNYLLLWLATPSYLAMESRSGGVGVVDLLLFIAAIGCLVIESIADHQQNVFHDYKVGTRTQNRPTYCQPVDIKRGFLTHGLFKYCRHPNYGAEQTLWWIMYAFGIVASGIVINWTIFGVFGLSTLFLSSTWLTESISCRKYKQYPEYQKRVGMFFPTSF